MADIKVGQFFRNSVFVFVCGLVLIFSLANTAADTNPTDINWFSGQPTIAKELEKTTWLPQHIPCTKTKIPVLRSYVYSTEEQCVYSSAAGLINSTATVIQPQGNSTGYPVQNYLPGGVIIIPVPNQDGALYIKAAQGSGVNIGLYRNFYSHLKFDYNFGSPRYTLNDQPDLWFKRSDNSLVQFNSGAMEFSSNGRYVVVDALSEGFVKIDLDTITVNQFADTLIRQNGSSLLEGFPALDSDGRFATIAYNAPGGWGDKFFKIIDTKACSYKPYRGLYNTLPNACQTRNIFPELQAAIPGLQQIANVTFVNSRTITFDARTKVNSEFTVARYSITAPGQRKNLVEYLAMGDSYISGEGAYDYRLGTDTGRNMCHQSLVSYPYLLSNKFSSFADVTCSGAKLINVNGTVGVKVRSGDVAQLKDSADPTQDEEDHSRQTYTPGYIAQQSFVTRDNPEAITLSVGGNDIGFGDIVTGCVYPLKDLAGNVNSASTCYSSYGERTEVITKINDQFRPLRELYKSIRDAQNTDRRLYVIGYPQVAKAGGDCGVNVQMNNDEIKFSIELIHYLNTVIKQAAVEAGAYYVDTEDAFVGHRLCEGSVHSVAVNGFTLSRSINVFDGDNRKESYHPNKLGHQLLADVVATKTHNLTALMPNPVAETDGFHLDANLALLQNVPKTSAPVRYVKSATNITSHVLEKASPTNIVLNSSEYSIKAASSLQVVLHSNPIDLGTFISDSDGNLNTTITVPGNTPPGFHTIHVYGQNVFGQSIDIQQPTYVIASENDYDGDGILNDQDSCQLISNSGQDIDQDGIDDACDPFISDPPLPIQQPVDEDIPTEQFPIPGNNTSDTDLSEQDINNIDKETLLKGTESNPLGQETQSSSQINNVEIFENTKPESLVKEIQSSSKQTALSTKPETGEVLGASNNLQAGPQHQQDKDANHTNSFAVLVCGVLISLAGLFAFMFQRKGN